MRKKYFVLPSYQLKWISRFLVLVAFSTLFSCFVTVSYLQWKDKKERGAFFYVTDEFGSDPLAYSRSKILLVPIVVSGSISLLLTFVLSLVYSHRLAGPIFRLRNEMLKILQERDLTYTFQLRKGDELDELANSMNELIQGLRQRILAEDKNRKELAVMAKKLLEEFTNYEKLESAEARKIALIKSIIDRLQLPHQPLIVNGN